jgi:cell division septation protein DedD
VRTVRFWAAVFMVCTIASLASYRVGRDWVGKRLADMKFGEGAPRILAQGASNAETGAIDEAKAPDKPEVTLEERAPTSLEAQRLKKGENATEPQDGAELNAQQEQVKPPKDDSSVLQGDGEGSEHQRYLVTAGSYAEEANASRVVARLAAKGYKPQVETVTRNGQTLRRITVAVVYGKTEAENLQAELAAEGIDAQVMPAH